VLATIDTLRADALGCYGNHRVETPWIDRLAAGGARFERAHAHNVVTLPSHANILSGRLPLEHGVRDNAGFRFPKETATLATILKKHGYRTGAFVSAFPLAARFGLDRGFDVYDDTFLTGGHAALAEQERPGADTVLAAQRWLEASTGAPRFLWVHLYEPHFPYAPPDPLASRYAHDRYHGEVAAADLALAPLLRPLVEAGRAGRTLVVLTADHGESLNEHGEKTHGIFAYEGPLRVPLVVFCPRLVRPRVLPEGGRHVDVLPTVLDALGIAPPPGLPGRSLLAAVAGEGGDPGPTYFEALSGLVNRRWAPLHGVLRGALKYIDLPIPELYDLSADPREERNLAASRPELRDEMRARLQELRAAERPVQREQETAETRQRLAALGYVSAAGPAPAMSEYTEDDDPKRLMALDAELQGVGERLRAGDRSGALALCREIVRRRPRMPQPLVQLASLERVAGNLEAAMRHAGQALELNPDDADTAALLAGYLNDAGRGREAAELLAPYVERVDPLPEALLVRGAALARSGRRKEALATFERLRELVPTHAMALLNIGTLHLVDKDYAAAETALRQALQLDPGLPQAYNALGVVAMRTGRPSQAVDQWKRAVELDPRAFDTLYNLGSELLRLGRRDEARPYLERFAREAPQGLYSADIARVRSWLAR
jgi:arylsulfatase A-like enzyme/Tfp pilus assembly protein PilF